MRLGAYPCKIKKDTLAYKIYGEENISESGQIDEDQAKPFSPPIDFTSSSVTSFFMEQRLIEILMKMFLKLYKIA